MFFLSIEKVWNCLQQPIWTYDSKDLYLITKLLGFILAQHLSDSSSPNKTHRIYTIDYSRLNCLKTTLFTAADTYIAHIWQYLPPQSLEYFLTLPPCWSLSKKNFNLWPILPRIRVTGLVCIAPLNSLIQKNEQLVKKRFLLNYQATTLNKNKNKLQLIDTSLCTPCKKICSPIKAQSLFNM